jgi:ABC-2 type transport system permease protein
MTAPAAPALEPVTERGWRRGLPNLLSAGFRAWWATRTWWVQVLIWTAVTSIPLAGVVAAPTTPDSAPPLTVFVIMSMFAAVAVAIIMQDEIVGERKSGTAAWVLSKPVSRTAFIVAKLVPNAVGILVTMVVVPGIVAYVIVAAADTPPDPIGFVAGLGVIGLDLLFFLTLTVMLGTLLDAAGAVIGIALAVAFGQQFLTQAPMLAQVIPWALVVPVGQAPVSDASALMLGEPLPAPLAIPFALVACVLFTAVAIWRFELSEF